MLVFLNPSACGGAAMRRWRAALPRLEAGPLRGGYELVTEVAALRRRIASASGSGGLVVAAGGDGTVNLVASTLMQLADPHRRAWSLGAIGLGSSNDFHRPRVATAEGPPLRLDAARARPCAVGRVRYLDEERSPRCAWFLSSASVGVVARANHLFNGEGVAARLLKPRWTAGAIGCAAARAVLGGEDAEARIAVDGRSWRARLTNAHVLLSPYVGGGLRYDVTIPDGAFAVALCEGLGRLRRVGVLLALSRGRFEQRPGTRVLGARAVEIGPGRPVPLETDGEVRLARAMRFEHVPGALNLCAG